MRDFGTWAEKSFTNNKKNQGKENERIETVLDKKVETAAKK